MRYGGLTILAAALLAVAAWGQELCPQNCGTASHQNCTGPNNQSGFPTLHTADYDRCVRAGSMRSGATLPVSPTLGNFFLLTDDAIGGPCNPGAGGGGFISVCIWTGSNWLTMATTARSSPQPGFQADDSDTVKVGDGSLQFNSIVTTPGSEESQYGVQLDCGGVTASRFLLDGCSAPRFPVLTNCSSLSTDAQGLILCNP